MRSNSIRSDPDQGFLYPDPQPWFPHGITNERERCIRHWMHRISDKMSLSGYFYWMVTQNLLPAHGGKHVFTKIKFNLRLLPCCRQISLVNRSNYRFHSKHVRTYCWATIYYKFLGVSLLFDLLIEKRFANTRRIVRKIIWQNLKKIFYFPKDLIWIIFHEKVQLLNSKFKR